MPRFGRLVPLTLALLVAPACDERDGDAPADDQDRGDVPADAEGCPDGDASVEIGASRACTCDDGTQSEQTCLSTGAYADCQCVGGGW